MAEASPEGKTEQVMNTLDPANLLKNEIDQVGRIYNIIVEFFTNYSFQLIGAIIILIIGFMFAGKIANLVLKVCEKHKLDVTLSRFLANASKMVIVVMIGIIALGKLGISVTPFIAAIGAISLGAGLALQGLLSNYAAGFNIIIIRPFVVGDTIQVQGVRGLVKEVLLAYTILTDEDDVEITIPNKHIVGEIIHNSQASSIVEIGVGIAYGSDPDAAIALIKQAVIDTEGVSADKEPQVGIDNFGDSSIDIGLRFWVPTESLFETKYHANLAVFHVLAENDIEIPFPQRHVHLINQGE